MKACIQVVDCDSFCKEFDREPMASGCLVDHAEEI